MRIDTIGNDGITVCREPPAAVSEEEMSSRQTRNCTPLRQDRPPPTDETGFSRSRPQARCESKCRAACAAPR
jgi:hypothetical protein